MTNPFITPKLLDDVRDELIGTYSNSGIEDAMPTAEEVVRSALIEIATGLRLDADEQERCNKVDECTAGALVRYQLADWLIMAKYTGENTVATAVATKLADWAEFWREHPDREPWPDADGHARVRLVHLFSRVIKELSPAGLAMVLEDLRNARPVMGAHPPEEAC